MASNAPRFVVGPDGSRRIVDKDGKDERIMGVHVSRDGHEDVSGFLYPAATAEARPGRNNGARGTVGSTLGTFVLGEVLTMGRDSDLTPVASGRVHFPGAANILKRRFKRVVSSEQSLKSQALSMPSAEVPAAVVTEDWLLCVTPTAGKADVRQVKGRLVDTGSVKVLQVTSVLPVYSLPARVTLCPANISDPASAAVSGDLVASLPAESTSNLIFNAVLDLGKANKGESLGAASVDSQE